MLLLSQKILNHLGKIKFKTEKKKLIDDFCLVFEMKMHHEQHFESKTKMFEETNKCIFSLYLVLMKQHFQF